MLFHSSVRKELARSFGAVLVVLLTVVMTMLLIRTLGQATKGSVNPQEVFMVLGYTVLAQLPTLLALSIFVAIVSVLSRLYNQSEMVVWQSSGLGLASMLRPIVRFAWLLWLFIFALTVWVLPWANQQIQDLRVRFQTRGDIERIAPGQFQESADGARVFFIDKDSDVTQSKNVFISLTEKGKHAIISGSEGQLSTEQVDGQDTRVLQLSQGQRVETDLATGAMTVVQFESYRTQVSSKPAKTRSVSAKTTQTIRLLRDPTPAHMAELSWRLGLFFAAINLSVWALAMTHGGPRGGKSMHLAYALLFFVVYLNLLTLGQSWIASGKVGGWAYMTLLHGGMALAGGLWLWWRHQQLSARRLWLRVGPRWFDRRSNRATTGGAA